MKKKFNNHIFYWVLPLIILSAYTFFYIINPVGSIVNPVSIMSIWTSYIAILLIYIAICPTLRYVRKKWLKVVLFGVKIIMLIYLLMFFFPMVWSVKYYSQHIRTVAAFNHIGNTIADYQKVAGGFPSFEEIEDVLRFYPLRYNRNLADCNIDKIPANTILITSAQEVSREQILYEVDIYGFCYIYTVDNRITIITEKTFDWLIDCVPETNN